MTPTMNGIWQSWLPNDTATPRRALAALGDMADGWSQAWIAAEPFRVAGALVRIDPRSELRKAQWHCHDGGLTIGHSATGLGVLGALVLGVPVVERPPADAALLEAVGSECIDDLKRRCADLFGLPQRNWAISTDRPAGPVHRLEITAPSRNSVLTIDVSIKLFVAFVKAMLPPAPPPPPLGNPGEALATLAVSLSALLGQSAITIAELSSLAEGDVLVLDRALDAPLLLAIDGKPTARGTCVIGQNGAALNIVEALIG